LKTIKNIFPLIYDFENLYEAWECAKRGKRFREEVLEFSNDLEANLIDIQNHLIYGTYEVGAYRPFFVYEPKKRLVMALPFRDRVVQWAIYKQLYPLLDKQFIKDSYACRKGKGAHGAADRLQYWLRQTDRKQMESKEKVKYYYLKLDISKYFYRVDHTVLIDILKRKTKDKQLIALLVKIIECENQKFGLPAGVNPDECPEEKWLDDVGMPIGNLTSQMFANLYLNELDQYVKHELKLHYYIRYMDDIIILHPDKKYLAGVRDYIDVFITDNLRLQLNNKTAIRPVSLGIDFVGFKVWATHRKLKKKTAMKIKNRIPQLIKAVECGKITPNSMNRSIASYKGILKHCNSFGFRKTLNAYFKKNRGESKHE